MRDRSRPTAPLIRLALAALVGVVIALWTWTRPGDPGLWTGAEGEDAVVVHVLDNGFHTDLAVPRTALLDRPGPLASAASTLRPADWIRIGWGDARFYVETSPIVSRLPDGARAFFWPGNASVVMLDPDDRDPADMAEGGRTLRLSRPAFEALRDRVEASLAPGPVIGTRRPGDDAVFLKSRETFWIGHLCNHWTAELLAAAGLPIRPLRSVTSAEVMRAAVPPDRTNGERR